MLKKKKKDEKEISRDSVVQRHFGHFLAFHFLCGVFWNWRGIFYLPGCLCFLLLTVLTTLPICNKHRFNNGAVRDLPSPAPAVSHSCF